jgi:pimeloyl-ACP methyl ester carboxylesterase
MSISIPRRQWRVLAARGILLVLFIGVAAASIEHMLELRDATKFTADDTFYAVGGRRIRYHLTGAGAPGPTLVLINGSSASLEQWSMVQAALGTDAPVLSYDRGGAGFSDPATAHDAKAEADELDQLLHCPGIRGPFVIVSYSSSSLMAIVFAAEHRDVVKGIVFVDPVLPSPAGVKSWRRIFWRSSLMNPLKAFFGITRMKAAIADRHAPPVSAMTQLSNAVLQSTHHWLADAQQSMSLDQSGVEAEAALATRPFATLPFGVLTTAVPSESEYLRAIFARQRSFAASSERSVFRVLHGDHSRLLNDPTLVAAVIDLIHTTGGAVHGVEQKPDATDTGQ